MDYYQIKKRQRKVVIGHNPLPFWVNGRAGEKERSLFKGVVFDDFMYVLYIELTFEEYEYAIFFRVFRGTDDDYDLVNDFLVFFEKHPDVFVVLLYFYHFGIVLKVQHFQISEVTFEKGGIVLQFLGREHFYAFHINARFVEFLFHQRHEYARHTYGCLVVLADECVYAGGLPAARHGAKAGKDKDEILHGICFLEFF